LGHDSSEIVLAQNPSINPDAPIAYYTVTSSKGNIQRFYSWRDLSLVVCGLQALTTYTFTVTATTADGTSPMSAVSTPVTTPAYVASASVGSASSVVSTDSAASAAQVTSISTNTASVTIPMGATAVAVVSNALGNPRLSFVGQGAVLNATIETISNPVSAGSTPFMVSGSTTIVDISVPGITGSATVCLDASPTAKLWHYVGGAWEDITSSRTASQVCGITSSFSPFVGEIQLSAPAFTISSSAETRTVNTALTGYSISHTGGLQVTYGISPAISNTPGLTFSTETGLLSGSPTSIASATTYTITATNATGSTSRTFTLTVVEALLAPSSTPSSSPESRVEDLAAPAFTLSSSAETRTVNTALTGYSIASTGGLIASYSISPAEPAGLTFSTSTGLLSGSPTSIASATTYTITATNATGSTSRTFTLTVVGGVYTVGQRGPGGGIVFYVAAQPFTSAGSTCNTQCKYLEYAPATWQSGGASIASDLNYAWSNNRNVRSVQDVSTPSGEGFISPVADEKYNWRIGQGFYNTSVMKVSGAVSNAQAAVLNYAGGGFKGQWFIPSLHELNELCKYARGQTTGDSRVACALGGLPKTSLADDSGGFVAGDYWSSSEYSPVTSPAAVALTQNFQNYANLTQTQKNSGRLVRPIRAF